MNDNPASTAEAKRMTQLSYGWLFVILIIPIAIPIVLFAYWSGEVQSKQAELRELIAEVRALLETDDLLDTESVIRLNDMNRLTDEITQAHDDVRDAEDRAFNLLGLFEVLGLIFTLGGVLVGAFGALSVKRYEEAKANFEEARQEVEKLKDSYRQENQKLKADFNETATNVQLAQSLARLAERQFRYQDLESARKTYERALSLTPEDPALLYHLGYILTQEADLEQAREKLEAAHRADSELPQAQAALGFVYRRLGDQTNDATERTKYYDQAEHYLRRALLEYDLLMDDDGEPWWGVLGGLYKRLYSNNENKESQSAQRQWKKAMGYYEDVERVAPQSAYGYINQVILYLLRSPQSVEQDLERINELLDTVERLARFEILAKVDNYWAYADLLHARLALGWEEVGQYSGTSGIIVNVTQTPRMIAERFFDALPEKVADSTDRVIETIYLIHEATILEDQRCSDDVFEAVLEKFGKPLKRQKTKQAVDNTPTKDDTEPQQNR